MFLVSLLVYTDDHLTSPLKYDSSAVITIFLATQLKQKNIAIKKSLPTWLGLLWHCYGGGAQAWWRNHCGFQSLSCRYDLLQSCQLTYLGQLAHSWDYKLHYWELGLNYSLLFFLAQRSLKFYLKDFDNYINVLEIFFLKPITYCFCKYAATDYFVLNLSVYPILKFMSTNVYKVKALLNRIAELQSFILQLSVNTFLQNKL